MATLTPNLGLTLPAGDENVSRQVINDNMMIIDAAAGNNSSLDAMQEGLTNIVDGDTTEEAIPAGAYAYLKNNTHGLAEGYYQNISGSAFPTSGGTASITTFAPVSTAGILNSLNNNITKHDFGTEVQLTNNVEFTAPSDGYIIPYCSASVNSRAEFTITVQGGNTITLCRAFGNSNFGGQACAYVRKGMKGKPYLSDSNSHVLFVPII